MGEAYEKVYTVTDYYDGPRGGIADFEGRPHLYASEWDDGEDDYALTFVLSPVDDKVFRLAIEDWEIWLRWETAFHEGRATQETHPALPEDRRRHGELEHLLSGRLVADPERSFRVHGDFRVTKDTSGRKRDPSSWEVRWE